MRNFERLLIGAGSCETILILTAAFFGKDPQLAGVLGNSLHSGLLISAAMAVALARKKSALYIFTALFMIASLFVMKSRSGILCAGLIAFYLFPRKMIWMSLVAGLIAIVLFFTQREFLLGKLELDAFTLPSTLGRVTIWRSALEAVAEKPITGYGLGNFESAYLLFRHPSSEYLRYGKTTVFAHNGFLQVAVETGLPGLVFFVWGLAAVLVRTKPLFFKEKMLFSILLVFFLTSLFNYSLALPFNGLIFVGAFALLASKVKAEKSISLKRHWIFPTTIVTLWSVFMASYGFSEVLEKRGRFGAAARVCPLRAQSWYSLALENWREGKPAFAEIDRALLWNSQDPFIWHKRAIMLSLAQPDNKKEIDNSYKRAQVLSPTHAPFYLEEGFYRINARDYSQAMKLFTTASELEPVAPMPYYALALLAKQLKDPKTAYREIEKALALKRKQIELESDPVFGMAYKEMFRSNYAQALFAINEDQLKRVLQ